MDLFFVILAIVLLIAGFFGTFVPVLPGVPLAYAGLFFAYFSEYCDISLVTLIFAGFFAVIVSILDNVFPVIMTKKYNGSKAALRGTTIGIIVGFFVGPAGILLGPYLGALIGELIHDKTDFRKALSVAWGAFLGFFCGTGAKLITVLVFIWAFIICLF